MKVTQSCPSLCNPMDYTIHGILQARILEWGAFPFSRGYSQPRGQTQASRITGRFFTSWATREARQLEWVAYPFSSGSSQPRNRTGVSCIAGRFFTNWAMRKAPTCDKARKNKGISLWASLVAQSVKNLPAVQETWVLPLGQKDPLEKETATTPVFLLGKSQGQRILAGLAIKPPPYTL